MKYSEILLPIFLGACAGNADESTKPGCTDKGDQVAKSLTDAVSFSDPQVSAAISKNCNTAVAKLVLARETLADMSSTCLDTQSVQLLTEKVDDARLELVKAGCLK